MGNEVTREMQGYDSLYPKKAAAELNNYTRPNPTFTPAETSSSEAREAV